ncbi:MAG: hypothetical protein HOG35_07985 [Candidatus Marinimicrobia bacterium]|nr:hypothetical protein [Candidatus Neomarinimicrobiota bacterium]
MSFISKFFNFDKKQMTDSPDNSVYDINIIEINMDDLNEFSYSLKDIQDLKISGLVIRNALSEETVNACVSIIKSAPDENKKEITSGIIYPEGFSTAIESFGKDENELYSYFVRNKIFRENIVENFGFDFESLIQDTFSQLSGGLKVEVPQGMNDKGSYISLTAKIIKPGQGSIPIHCGNVLQYYFDDFYEHLEKSTSVYDQVSYFIMLDPSDSGGELTLYNTLWSETQKIIDNSTLENLDGEKINIEDPNSIGKQQLKLNPGDMIIFSGGQIWHRIEEIRGSKDRITIGGFIAYSKNNEKLYYWS